MDTNKTITVHIQLATDSRSKNEGMRLICEMYKDALHISPEMPSYLFTAHENEVLVGAFGIMCAEKPPGLRLLKIYTLQTGILPFLLPENTSVEFGRWVSTSSKSSALLIYEAIRFARNLGKEYVLCEHTDSVHRRAQRFGITFYHLSSILCQEGIEERYKKYYEHYRTSLYAFVLEDAEIALFSYLQRNTYV